MHAIVAEGGYANIYATGFFAACVCTACEIARVL